MAQELLVTQQLTEEMRKAGENLVRLLDKHRFAIRAAFWFYLADQAEWRLYLAMPEARAIGPKKLYKKLQSVLARETDVPPLSMLVVVDTKDPLVQLLGVALKVDGVGGVRFSRNTINGRFIEDAYIYRLAA